MSAWARWYERHWRDWRPAAYRPGATLALVRRNLAACDGEAQDGRLLLRTKELSLEVRERVQAHLFMHIVSTEFSLFVAAPGGAAGQPGAASRRLFAASRHPLQGTQRERARAVAGGLAGGRPGLAGAAHAAGLPELAPLPRRQGLDREPGTPGGVRGGQPLPRLSPLHPSGRRAAPGPTGRLRPIAAPAFSRLNGPCRLSRMRIRRSICASLWVYR